MAPDVLTICTKLSDAFQSLKNSVPAEVQEDYAQHQIPVLKTKWNGDDLMIAVPPAAPQAIPQTVKEILEPDSTTTVPIAGKGHAPAKALPQFRHHI
jgi:hypothetical protein